ncbi:flagellar assembly protein FlgT [Paraglaciecola sp. L3A3]|uniref:flagellar assembly protein FlgT n=1 Tax=Paraglaciecola sp. L3A3 TaxID=2686358 RepID=UPI00131C7D3E|nr:flagellar assembly protein FlgT [Paraglaciecola sp. L3A3]
MKLVNLTKILLCSSLLTISLPALSIWFEASGQAVIHNGDKTIAKQQATQEAIKQALLFAGASVKSVQHMANGLISEDRLEVTTSGEVASVELISEVYQGDVITVSVRADIFPQETFCSASDYKKNIITTWYKINKRQQAAVGNMFDFGKVLANRLQQASQKFAQHSNINAVENYYIQPNSHHSPSQAMTLAKKTGAQYVLLGEILDFGIETEKSSKLTFWKENKISRNLSLAFSLYDGNSGELIFKDQVSITAPWRFNLHSMVNSEGPALWQSGFGKATQELILEINKNIDDTVSCLPAYGRVVATGNEQLTINIGKQNGVKEGDVLTLFQVNYVYDDNNQTLKHYQLHPEKVKVTSVFHQSAIVVSQNGVPLANIQPNDFVARR